LLIYEFTRCHIFFLAWCCHKNCVYVSEVHWIVTHPLNLNLIHFKLNRTVKKLWHFAAKNFSTEDTDPLIYALPLITALQDPALLCNAENSILDETTTDSADVDWTVVDGSFRINYALLNICDSEYIVCYWQFDSALFYSTFQH
jgi:hypothetical protein